MRISDWSSDVCSSDLIEEDVDDAPGAIAQRGRAQDRQHQVEDFESAVSAEGLAEVLLVAGKARFGGEVKQAEHADGGVNGKAGAGDFSALHLALQQVVGRSEGNTSEREQLMCIPQTDLCMHKQN